MEFLSKSIDNSSFFRISISLLALISIFSYWDEYLALFGGKSVDILSMHKATNFREIIPYKIFSILSQYVETQEIFLKLRYVYLGSLLFLFFGFFTRIAALVAFLSNMVIYYNSPLMLYGYDDFMYFSLLFCVLFSVSSKLSLDSLLCRYSRRSNYLLPFITTILCVCYFFSGLSKAVDGAGWYNGQKIINALHYRVGIDKNLYFADFLSKYYFIAIFLGIFTVMVELSYPILFYFKKTRSLLLFLIIALHFGIAIMLQLTAFSLIMIVWNITLLYDFENDSKNLSGFWMKFSD